MIILETRRDTFNRGGGASRCAIEVQVLFPSLKMKNYLTIFEIYATIKA
jgi:hypothetical protein